MKVIYDDLTGKFSTKPDTWTPPAPIISNGKIISTPSVRVVHWGDKKECNDYIKTYQGLTKNG